MVHQFGRAACIAPDAAIPTKMEAARLGSYPDLAGNTMAIDDDLAAIGKLDLEHPTRRQLKIDVGVARFQRRLDPGQHSVGQLVEFLVIHRVLPSRSLPTAPSR